MIEIIEEEKKEEEPQIGFRDANPVADQILVNQMGD